MGVSCKIILDEPSEGVVYRAGQPVSGVVVYAIDKPTEYTDVTLSLIGEGECSWTVANPMYSSDDVLTTSRRTGQETYVNKHITVLKKQPGGKSRKLILPVGSYKSPFKVTLPKAIPPSFTSSKCTISYKMVMKFEQPGLFGISKIFNTDIPVYGCINETQNCPMTLELKKTLFKPFSRKNQVIDLKAAIANTVLTPGRNAQLALVITNDTDVNIQSIKTELVSYTTYIADCGSTTQEDCTVKECTVNTPQVENNTVGKFSVEVPILPYLHFIQNSKILRRNYKLRVTVKLPIPHNDESGEIPVVIGVKPGGEVVDEVATEASEDTELPPSYWDVVGDQIPFEKDQGLFPEYVNNNSKR